MQVAIFESEYNFCKILWENEPIKSTELVKLCKEKLEWKKSTTYTVIKRLLIPIIIITISRKNVYD